MYLCSAMFGRHFKQTLKSLETYTQEQNDIELRHVSTVYDKVSSILFELNSHSKSAAVIPY